MREGASLFILNFLTEFYPNQADLPRKSHDNKYIICFWLLLTQLTTEGLPHDFYMTFYISNISRRRNKNNVKYKQNILRCYTISTLPLNKKGILLTTITTSVARHNIIGRIERGGIIKIIFWNIVWYIYRSSEVLNNIITCSTKLEYQHFYYKDEV